MENLDRKLPSTHQFGDEVNVTFFNNGVFTGTVVKIHFTESKVFYDLEVEFKYKGLDELGSTRVYNVDSAFVTARN